MLRQIGGIVAIVCLAVAQVAPKALFRPEPKTSVEAQRLGVGATVHVTFVVDEHGKTQNVLVPQRVGFGLDEKAMDAVKRWLFEPVQKDGKPVAVEAHADLSFPQGAPPQLSERLTFDLPVKIGWPQWKTGTPLRGATNWTTTNHHAEVEFDVAQDGTVSGVHSESYAPNEMKEMVRTWRFLADRRRPKKTTGRLEVSFP